MTNTATDIAADAAIALSAAAFAATATVDHIGTGLGYRATLAGHGGSAALGYGADADAARDDLAATIAYNLAHNDRPIA